MKVEKVGIEIEGAFKKRFDDTEIHHDGSLTLPPEVKEWSPKGHLGEVCTGDGGILFEDMEKWVRAHYPDASNASCGIHIHVSFGKNLEEGFARCSQPGFYAHFLKEMNEWGKKKLPIDAEGASEFWKRLKGENEYCKLAFVPTVQARRSHKNGNPQLPVKNGGDRYCHLNFRLHWGTIEARLLPTFKDPDLTVSALKKIVDIFNTWLALPWGEKKERFRLSLKEARMVPPKKKVVEPSLQEMEDIWSKKLQALNQKEATKAYYTTFGPVMQQKMKKPTLSPYGSFFSNY